MALDPEPERSQKAIASTLDFYRDAIGWLADRHATWGIDTPPGIDSEDREPAVWKVAGDVIAQATALVDQLEDGYTQQTLPLIRSIHEGSRLVAVLANPEEDAILRSWLANKEIKQSELRKAQEREAKRVAAEMREAGIDPGNIENVAELSRTIYGRLSKGPHHYRQVVDEAVDFEARTMVYGPDPRIHRRVDYLAAVGPILQEVLLLVGDALSFLYGPNSGFYVEQLRPMAKRMEEVVETFDQLYVTGVIGRPPS
ncbi:MAG TPA: hypothetical protein VHF90_06030 [Thermoleophilaceae bacterium]|nr:hypothetical protein [Thermoleophilaceae bacterium]